MQVVCLEVLEIDLFDDLKALEVIVALLLLTGEARIVTTSLNRETGFFTLNVGSDYFRWKDFEDVCEQPIQSNTTHSIENAYGIQSNTV